MKNLEEMIAVMQASKTKEIECRMLYEGQDHWTTIPQQKLQWNWASCDYRVKPQGPRRVWVASDMVGNSWVLRQPDSTLSNAAEYVELTPEVRKAIEMLDETIKVQSVHAKGCPFPALPCSCEFSKK